MAANRKSTKVQITKHAQAFVDYLLGRGFKNPAIRAIAANCSHADVKDVCVAYAKQCHKDGTAAELVDIHRQERDAWKIERQEMRVAAVAAAKDAAKAGKSVDNKTGKVVAKRSICRATIFGSPVTAVLRAIGKKGKLSVDDALRAVIELGAETISITTVRIQLKAGRDGTRGEPANLSSAQWKKVTKLSK